MSVDIITSLQLKARIEGGYSREVFRSNQTLQTDLGKRHLSSSHYYYLDSDDHVVWHRLAADVIVHFYTGSGLTVHLIDPAGKLTHVRIGDHLSDSARANQVAIPAGYWFAAEVECDNSYVFMGCTYSPDVHKTDIEIPKVDDLIKQFPQYADLLKRLSR